MKSYQAQATKPFLANGAGTYIVAGDSSGDISLWEVTSGRLLKKWNAHYRAVTCLVFSDDDSLLISGAEDGFVRVWSLFMLFDDIGREQARNLYEHSFTEHTLRVTDIATGYGGCNAIIVSASEDRTCKVWSLSKGKLLRNIVFPSIIDAIALDPGEHVFFAGGRDGKIYITALNAESSSRNSLGMHILGSLSDHSKAITFCEYGLDGNLLVSGSEDCMVRVWDVRTGNLVRKFKHSKGLVRQSTGLISSQTIKNSQASLIRLGSSFSPPLEKYANSTEEDRNTKSIISLQTTFDRPQNDSYLSSHLISNQIKEFEQQGSGAAETETERQKVDCKRSMEMVQQWKQLYVNLHEFSVNQLLGIDQV